MADQQAYVTGTSILASAGIGSDQVWNSIINQNIVQGTREYVLSDGQSIKYPVYPMPKINLQDWLDSSSYEQLEETGLHKDQDFVYLLAAAKLALQDADLKIDQRSRVALIVGHENLGVNHLIDQILTTDRLIQIQDRIDKDVMSSYEAFSKEFFTVQTFPHLFYLAKALGVKGATYTVNNACATGLYALELGKMLIETKQTDIALIVCSDYAHATEHLWLEQKGFCSKSGALKPFDQARDGSVLGDGAAAIILESATHLEHRIRKPICRYAGGSFKQGVWNMTLPDVVDGLYSKAMAEAQQLSSSGSVDLLVPHGAGIPLWDQFESKEILKWFALTASSPDITAFKGYIGHTLGANSLIESVLAIYSMKYNLIPPIGNLQTIDAKMNLPFIQDFKEKRINSVMKAVSAYGGFNAASIFEKVSEG